MLIVLNIKVDNQSAIKGIQMEDPKGFQGKNLLF